MAISENGLILPDNTDPRIIKPQTELPDNSDNNSVKFIKAKFIEAPDKAGEMAEFNWDKSLVVNPMEFLSTIHAPVDVNNPNHLFYKINKVKPIDFTYCPNETTFNNMQIIAAYVPVTLSDKDREQVFEQIKSQLIRLFLGGCTADFAELDVPYYQCGVKYQIGDIVICTKIQKQLLDKVLTDVEMVYAILPYTSELTNLDGSVPYSKDMNKPVIDGEGKVMGDDTDDDIPPGTPLEPVH